MKKNYYKKAIYSIATVLLMNNLTQAQDPKPEFKPSGKVWGYVFGDYYYKLNADSLNRGSTQYSGVPKDMSSFDLRRAYLGYDYNISERFSTELIISYEGGTLPDGTRSFFLKAANLRWKDIFKYTDLVIGQHSTPSFSLISEKIWGYRSVEKTLLDMRKIAGSNDVGISLQGKFNEKGDYGYNLMAANGTGAKPESDLFKKFYADIYLKFIDQKLIVDLYADFERSQLDPYHKSKKTFKAFLAYNSDPITIGIEIYQQTQNNYTINADSITSTEIDTTDAVSFGTSFFVRGKIINDKLGFFARYDMYNPDTEFNSDKYYYSGEYPNTESFIVAGLDYTPHKNVHIMPNIWYDGFSNRTANVSGLEKKDSDLAARITLFYIFK